MPPVAAAQVEQFVYASVAIDIDHVLLLVPVSHVTRNCGCAYGEALGGSGYHQIVVPPRHYRCPPCVALVFVLPSTCRHPRPRQPSPTSTKLAGSGTSPPSVCVGWTP